MQKGMFLPTSAMFDIAFQYKIWLSSPRNNAIVSALNIDKWPCLFDVSSERETDATVNDIICTNRTEIYCLLS